MIFVLYKGKLDNKQQVMFPSWLNAEAADAAVCFGHGIPHTNAGSAVTKAANAAVSSVGTGAFKISPLSFPRHCLHLSAHKNTSD